jgi:hypothetical protein
MSSEIFSYQAMINLAAGKVSQYLDRFSDQYVFLVPNDVIISDKSYLAHMLILLCESTEITEKEELYEIVSDMCGISLGEVEKLAMSSRKYYDDMNRFINGLNAGLYEFLKPCVGTQFEPEFVSSVADNYCEHFVSDFYKEMGISDIRSRIFEGLEYDDFDEGAVICYDEPDPSLTVPDFEPD